jgi:hypothetical protein
MGWDLASFAALEKDTIDVSFSVESRGMIKDLSTVIFTGYPKKSKQIRLSWP